MKEKSTSTFWNEGRVTRQDREKLNHHRGMLLWFTGLSGSGKTTLVQGVEERLFCARRRTFILDGDNIRQGLCGDLGFSVQDRVENIRRVGEVGKLFVDAGVVVLAGFISPFRADRQRVRALLAPGDFVEVHCKCSLEICERRDVKGLYKRARAGEIPDFTGITSPYEAPVSPELVLDTGVGTVADCVAQVAALAQERLMLSGSMAV